MLHRGTIDGNGWNLWENSKKTKRMANNLLAPKHVSGFTCDGLIIRDPSAWSTIPVRSDNVVFRNMKFFCRLNMGENDGIDVVECQDVLVQNAIGIALDDPFSTKSWSATTDIALNWSGEPEPLRNVLIEDTISWTHCYGYKVGQGVMQDQDGVTFRNGVVYDAAIGLGVHHKYGKAEARNITFENIEIERQHGHNDGKAAWLVLHVQENGAGVGPIKGVHLKDILVQDAGSGPAMIKGHGREGWISDVRFENIHMPGSSTPARNMHELNLHIRDSWSDVTILPEQIAEPPQRKNLARGAKVTTSSVDKNRGENAVDGTLDTRWGSERSDDQWIAVDLGSRQVVDGVKLVWEAAYGKAFAIQVSDDGARWRTVARTTSGDGGIDEIDFQAVPARHVRMHGLKRGTKWGYSLWEFEVYAANQTE